MRNLEYVIEWMKRRDTSVYQHIGKGYILLPGTDHILDLTALMASGNRCPERVSIVQNRSSSHFIALDDRSWTPRLEPMVDAVA